MGNKINDLGLISVIIPTYNRARIIEKSISSVLNQTYENIECIVIDDCSTDNTEEIVKSIDDKRLIYYKLEKNGGAIVARNKGIDLSNGKFIAFQDSDDFFKKDKLEKQLNALMDNNADMVYCQLERYGYGEKHVLPIGESGFTDIERVLNVGGVSNQAMFFKAEVIKQNKFDEEMISWKEDLELTIRLVQKYKVYFLAEPLVEVYLSKDSLTTASMYKKDVLVSEYFLKKYDNLVEKYPNWGLWLKNNIAFNKTMLGENATELYKEIYSLQPNKSNKMKLTLSKLRLLKLYYKIKKQN